MPRTKVTGKHGFTVETKTALVTLCERINILQYRIYNLLFSHCKSFWLQRRSQNELQKQKQEAEKLTNMLTVLEKESQELKSNLTASQKEGNDLKKEHQALLEWKKEKETLINETEAVQKDLTDKIGNLEKSLTSVNEATDQLKVRCTGSQCIHLD